MPPPRLRAFRDDVNSAFTGSIPKKAAFVVLLTVILSAPFPWGSVQPGWTGVHKLLVLSFLGAALAALAPDAPFRLGKARLPAAAVAGIGIVGIVQLLPLPAWLLSIVAPENLATWKRAGATFLSFGRPAPAPRISLAPWETAEVSLLTFSFVALFATASAVLDTRARRRLFAVCILASGFVQLIFAFGTEDRLSRLRGSFVNPNHFAGYLLIPLSFAFGLLWYRIRYESGKLASAERTDDRFRRLEHLLPRTAGALLAWALVLAGIVMTQSRGGIMAAGGGTVILVTFALLHRREPGRLRSILAVTLAVGIFAGTVFALTATGDVPFLRFLASDPADLDRDGRVLIWSAAVRASRLSPVFGAGLGCFREGFRAVQPASFAGLVDQAHQEYLQLLVTGGFVGAGLGLLALLAGLHRLLRGLYGQSHREEAAFCLGGVGALVLLLLHGTVEFNFSIPAIPAVVSAALGGGWGALRWKHSDEPFGPSRHVRA